MGKIVCSEGCVYEVIIPKGNITMMKYDSNWNVYERLNLEYGNSGDYWEATEGTYYFIVRTTMKLIFPLPNFRMCQQ